MFLRRRLPRATVMAVGILLAGILAGCNGSRVLKPAGTTAMSRTSTAPSPRAHRPRDAEWLGVAYNSSANTGGLEQFSRVGVVYDRDGPLQGPAGEKVTAATRLGQGLKVSLAAGMVPVVILDPVHTTEGCTGDPNVSTDCIPTSPVDVRAYVRGFIRTVLAVHTRFPRQRVLFEPMNEPWNWAAPPGTESGRTAAGEYAAVLSQLLPAARRAGIALDDILVQAATGPLADGTQWIPDLYAAKPCLGSHSSTRSCGPISAWSIHPYGLPGRTTEGIDSVPPQHAQMVTGADNVYITEIGFCSRVAFHGSNCNQNLTDITGSPSQTASWMDQTLNAALAMHRAGWLKALIVWDRTGDGWAMENSNGSLTAAGQVLFVFSRRYSHPQRP